MTDKRMTRTEAFAALSERNVAKAVVCFSGGGDEGGPDDIVLHDGDGAIVGDLHQVSMANTSQGDETQVAALVEALEQPVFDEYGGFSGDFDVSGEVVWNVPERAVRIEKSERASYEYSEYEV